jgi:Holliday junction resolvase RusA-like endonuclease
MREPITFSVTGMEPAPQGSKVPFKTRSGKLRTRESSAALRPWRRLVLQAALATRARMMPGAVSIHFEFLFQRPKFHFSKAGELRPTAPAHHCVMPDASKLARSTEEELSKRLIEDDSRIAILVASKRYCVPGESPGAVVTIVKLPDTVAEQLAQSGRMIQDESM